jgi:hypothetical protein
MSERDMNPSVDNPFRERVVSSAEAVLKTSGSVGPLELFSQMGLLHPVHFEGWRRQIREDYKTLQPWIQVGPEKLQRTLEIFGEWVRARGLKPVEASYQRRTPRGISDLQITHDGDPNRERFYRTHYAPAELSAAKAKRLDEKLKKAPDLVVHELVSEDARCSECGVELPQGSYSTMEQRTLLCLDCADLSHLVFLPAGDATLSRRSRKLSPLSAVVVRFNRRRNRYERQGILVTAEAIQAAEEACDADAPDRALQRRQAAAYRQVVDARLVDAMVEAILEAFPGCPANSARQIATHTAERGSGRVGRSAAGRALDSQAVKLAVIAHIRHQHTPYDELLMAGVDRQEARERIREQVESILTAWSGA